MTLPALHPGDTIADRFEIEHEAGEGGMSRVYRAIDLDSGTTVALKVLLDEKWRARFEVEAKLLSELAHPGIVRYVAHGGADASIAWLAMEWLEGEDLFDRLDRARPTWRESLGLVQRASRALAVAHARGIVHRDVKPSNLFLVGRDIADVKLLDFGIARVAGRAKRASRATDAIGTPGYMSPEQARGERSVDARSDVFSLGCVLFECLTGQPPFLGKEAVAVLAKVLLEEAPRLRELHADVPDALDALVAAMLSKVRDERPADALAVASALSSILEQPFEPEADAAPPSTHAFAANAIGSAEQRLVAILLVGASDEARPAVIEKARSLGAHPEPLAEGGVVITQPALGRPLDQAARAAACALALKDASMGATMALVLARCEVGGRLPIGAAIDRAAALLRAAGGHGGAVRIDELTAALLGGAFTIQAAGSGLELVGTHEVRAMEEPTLLGKPMPCVGRDDELRSFEALADACIEGRSAKVVLVTASAGGGKSRLRRELVRLLAGRFETWIARGDPVGSGSAFALAAQIVRRATGALEGEPAEQRREKLGVAVSRSVAAADRARVAEFLGELLGAPSVEPGIELQAARSDPALMGDQIRRAWEDFVGAESLARPLLVVLEDLHWGDLPSVSLVDSTLRLFPDRPLFFLALARPEVRDTFPALWRERGLVDLELPPLSISASDELVRSALGESSPKELRDRLVELGSGNPFALEELVRAATVRKDAAFPETILAMVEARLESLDPESRRVLRAASVFGQKFWTNGVAKLLDDGEGAASIEQRLSELAHEEFVAPAGESKFAGEAQYVFRHALLRDAAHATLTDADRAIGHRLAADWLEAAGEQDAVALAEHLRLAGSSRAVRWYARAAEQAFEGNDFKGALARVALGIGCGARGELLPALQLTAAEAHRFMAAYEDAASCASEAMRLSPEGSDRWGDALGELALSAARSGRLDRMVAESERLVEILSAGRASPGCVRGASRVAYVLYEGSRFEVAEPILSAAETAWQAIAGAPITRAHLLRARAMQAHSSNRPATFLALSIEARAAFEEAGDARNACAEGGTVGYAQSMLGAFEDARKSLLATLSTAERMGLLIAAAFARQNLGATLGRLGRFGEALRFENDAVRTFEALGNRAMAGISRAYLAAILVDFQDLEGAEREARRGAALVEEIPAARAHALGTLARVLSASGRIHEALSTAQEAMAILEPLGGLEEGETALRLVYAEALAAAGDQPAACAAIRVARDRLLARAENIEEPRLKTGHLTNFRENARTLALATEWLGERP